MFLEMLDVDRLVGRVVVVATMLLVKKRGEEEGRRRELVWVEKTHAREITHTHTHVVSGQTRNFVYLDLKCEFGWSVVIRMYLAGRRSSFVVGPVFDSVIEVHLHKGGAVQEAGVVGLQIKC